MKIYVCSRAEIKGMLKINKEFAKKNYFISIYSSEIDYGWGMNGEPKLSPLPNLPNVCKLCFDDVTEKDKEQNVIHFNKEHAQKIMEFLKTVKDDGKMEFYVHCDAGVSRSGAVGYLLNEYFNKFLKMNRIDNEAFRMNNSHIMPNPEVMRILKLEMFGAPFRGIEVNDIEYNEDGERMDHITKI